MRAAITTLLFTATASLAVTGASFAADLPARTTYTKAPDYVSTPPCAWCGWYIGVNGGGAWGNHTGGVTDFPPDAAALLAAGAIPTDFGAKHDGAFGGGQFGYNWVVSNWLVGFEGDIQGADIGKTNTTGVSLFDPGSGLTFASTSTGRDHIDWFGTARARLGFTAGNVLFYGTGGLAFGGVTSSIADNVTPTVLGFSLAGSSSDTRFGWAAGAGLEWMFASNWSLKAEYLHVDLGSSIVRLANPTIVDSESLGYRFHHDFDSARVGVNYHFGGPIVAKY